MTDQPTKGPFEIGRARATALAVHNGQHVVAKFYDPNREANARLFIRVQHMDELVEAVKALRLAVYTVESQVNDTGEYDESAALGLFTANEAIAPILSKIKGEK